MNEKIRLRDEGVRLGFETVDMLKETVRHIHQVCSAVVVLAFESIGPSFTGDLLVNNLDEIDDWSFHSSPYMAAVDASFDYKHERRNRLDEHKIRRLSRICPVEMNSSA